MIDTTTPATIVDSIISNRRNIKPTSMNGKKIADETVRELLQMADWAPTHGYTEPWYFVVFSGEKVQEFCTAHADMYKQYTLAEKYIAGNYDKLKTQGDLASHVIAITMKRGNKPNIPVVEEVAAVACAVQNMWLSANARGISGYWGSGGMTFHPAMKDYLGLGDEDQVLGFFYLGYSDEAAPAGKRVKPAEEKFKWM
ncbi:Nitroreductase [Chitinophaga jiangningensis]|uniref:Putative NAD(P)H nitroreductase n=1 Tax=Chitinophaga jiangningensis TaxID=1419482 RepID=A0A1M7FKS2_9BACT|nr:nitroreductase [Chitinophaga jiangningensis]SHM04368.1 Nitroreductase [Chitinophaga jiangningensis]